MMADYVAIADTLTSRRLVPANENILNIVKKNPRKELYTSLYTYHDKHLLEFNKTKSLSGITDVKTKHLFFDFDDAEHPTQAQNDAVEVCLRLREMGVPDDAVQIYFSGNKGIHIDVPLKDGLTRQEFVNIVFNVAADLKTFDVRINDEARIIRSPFSMHPKSGLYKIPITFAELKELPIEAIKTYAESLDSYDLNTFKESEPIDLPEEVDVLKSKAFKKIVTIELTDIKGFNIHDIDFSKAPRWMAKERYALLEGYFYGSESVTLGERNIAFMVLASTLKNQGFSSEHTLAILETTAEKQALRTGEPQVDSDQLQREIINTVFSPQWKGGTYDKNEPILQLTRKRFNLTETASNIDLVDIKDVGDEFQDFAKNIDKNTIKTGLKSLDDNVLITSGMMVALLAAPGAGKTSFANLFVEHMSQTGENTIFFSLDMYKNLLFSRLLQKYSGYDMRKILHMYKNNNPDKILIDAYSEVLKNYSNAHFNFKSGPTVEEIEEEIITYQQEKGKNAKLVVVDYLEKVRGPFSDATANSAYVASRLSDIAKKYHTTVLLLVQPQKSAGDPREELVSYRKIKGASVIEQDSRVILTMSRPGYDPRNMNHDKFATISVVKNNMGSLCQLDFMWEGITGQLTEMNSDERYELKALRERIAQEKLEVSRGYDI
jgi:replicative DNA helicase